MVEGRKSMTDVGRFVHYQENKCKDYRWSNLDEKGRRGEDDLQVVDGCYLRERRSSIRRSLVEKCSRWVLDQIGKSMYRRD